MASRVIRFLPRQSVAGNDTSAVGLFSEIFDVTDLETLVVETRVYSAEPATAAITVSIEETSDPAFALWTELGTASVTASSGVGRTKTTLSNPTRFVRAKYTVAADAVMVASIETVGRGPA